MSILRSIVLRLIQAACNFQNLPCKAFGIVADTTLYCHKKELHRTTGVVTMLISEKISTISRTTSRTDRLPMRLYA